MTPSMIRMATRAGAAVALLALQAVAQSQGAPRVRYTDFTLPNGLRVIVSESHASPLVAVEVWYGVGYKNDPIGRSGLAHLFEHMMFEGTKNVKPGEHGRIIREAGGIANAATWEDPTRYFQVVPSHLFETALWLEAERMNNLLPALDSVRFERARGAVANEYRQRFLDVALTSARLAMSDAILAGTSYARMGLGYHRELFGASLDDLREFYDRYYVPNNAVVVIVGDVTLAEARRLVERHFGPIPRGAPIPPVPERRSTLTGERRVVVEHPTNFRSIWFGWSGANTTAPDRLAAVALAAVATERFRAALEAHRIPFIHNPAFTGNFDLAQAGIFVLGGTLSAAGSATEVEQVMDSIVAAIREQGVTDAETRRWAATYRTQMMTDQQTVGARAMSLGDATLHMGNPLGIIGTYEGAASIRPGDIQAAARKYLIKDRVVVNVVGSGKLDMISKPELPWVNVSLTDSVARTLGHPELAKPSGWAIGVAKRDAVKLPPRPVPGPAARYVFPRATVDSLPNGLRFTVVENHTLPVVSVRALFPGSGPRELSLLDREGKEGLWSLTLSGLHEGTTTRSPSQLASEIADLGLSSIRDRVGLPLFQSTSMTWEPALSIMADVLMHPTFPDDAVARGKAVLSTQMSRQSTQFDAYQILYQTLYGPAVRYPTTSSVAALTPEDVRAMHADYIRPQNIVIMITGDVTPAQARAAVAKSFGGWERGGKTFALGTELPTVAMTPAATTIYLKDRPNLAQSVIMAGQLVPGRGSADAPALRTLASILNQLRVPDAFRNEQALAYVALAELPDRPIRETVPLIVGMPVNRANTDSAVAKLARAFRELAGPRPVTAAEVEFAKQNLIGRIPWQRETFESVNNTVAASLRDGLPPDYLNTWTSAIAAVTVDKVQAAVKNNIDPDHLAIVVVGDRASLEPKLRATGIPVVILDRPQP